MDSWTCVMVEKGPGILSEKVRAALKIAACDLHLEKRERARIFNTVIEGVIETKWDTHIVGARSGVLFRAQIDCEDGTDYKVNFLLSEEDLERGASILREEVEAGRGAWRKSPFALPPALTEFYDLRHASERTLH